jgi:hypothetical protein
MPIYSSNAKHSSQNCFALRMKVTVSQEAANDLDRILAWVA